MSERRLIAPKTAALLAAALLGACTAAAEPAASVQADPSVDVAAWRTFTWAGPASPQATSPALETEARDAVARTLQERGYVEAQPGEPVQFAVAVYFGDPGAPQLYTEGPYYGVAPDPRAGQRGWGGLLDWPAQQEPTPGMLTVAFVDTATRRPVWIGASRAHLGRDAQPADVDAVVAAVLADFPSARE